MFYKKIGYSYILTLMLTFFLIACSESNSCNDDNILKTLQSLQTEDAEKFQKQIREANAKNFWFSDADFLSLAIQNTNITNELEQQGIFFKNENKITKISYTDFTTENYDSKTKKKTCIATVNGSIDLKRLGSVTFKNFLIKYQIQPTDNNKNIRVWFLNTLSQ